MATEAIVVEPVTLVIFGGAGDLAHRKLLPALYNLHVDGLLPRQFAVVSIGRRDYTDEVYRKDARDSVTKYSRRKLNEQHWATFAKGLFFINASIESADAFATIGSRLDLIEHERGVGGNRIFYLAIPPAMFEPTVKQLHRARFIAPPGGPHFNRVIIEKPIGHDLASAMAINDGIAAVFDEKQIFRIDHYLGKETVQNILVLRFANSILEPLFNYRFIDHVQITVAEAEGVGTRAGYYDESGALRDMVQNHLLQLLALVAMEPPHSLNADVVRDERLEVIQSLRPLVTPEAIDQSIVRGQYAAGVDPHGQSTRAYRAEDGVPANSSTETYVALKVFIDNWRWFGVPFFLRTGKRMPRRCSEIAIQLKDVPPILFNARGRRALEPNVLTIRIQPDEGYALKISSKVPGPQVDVEPVSMDFTYSEMFGGTSPEAYERLLLDVMVGDATLFMRRDQVEASWKWLAPVLDRWSAAGQTSIPEYAAGSWGPKEADALIATTGAKWRTP